MQRPGHGQSMFAKTEKEELPELPDKKAHDPESKRKQRCDASGLTVALSKRFPDKVKIRSLLPVARFLESRPVQIVITILFILDVIIVLAELIIETEILRLERNICEEELARVQNESCTNAETAAASQPVKRAETTAPANDTGHDTGGTSSGDLEVLHGLETAERVLHWVSIGILVRFLCFFLFVFSLLLVSFCARAADSDVGVSALFFLAPVLRHRFDCRVIVAGSGAGIDLCSESGSCGCDYFSANVAIGARRSRSVNVGGRASPGIEKKS